MTTISGNCQVFFSLSLLFLLLHLVLKVPFAFILCWFLSILSSISSVSLRPPDVRNIKALSISLKEIKIEWRIKFG